MLWHRHPQKRLRVRGRIAKLSWWKLFVLFLFVLLVMALGLALVDGWIISDSSASSLNQRFGRYVLLLLDAPETEARPHTAFIVAALAGLCKLLLIVVLLGVIVFKLTVLPALFVHRKKLSIYFDHDNRFALKEPGWLMVARIYNSTQLEIIDINFAVYLRVPQGNGPTAHTPNRQLEIVEHRKSWPVAIPFVPFSVCIRLNESDVIPTKQGPELRSIQGHQLTADDSSGTSFLVLIIRAKTPEVDSEIVETHWFRLSKTAKPAAFLHRLGKSCPEPEYEFGKFREIEVEPGKKPKKAGGSPAGWDGWDFFEKCERESAHEAHVRDRP
jgi:hypothetical protein